MFVLTMGFCGRTSLVTPSVTAQLIANPSLPPLLIRSVRINQSRALSFTHPDESRPLNQAIIKASFDAALLEFGDATFVRIVFFTYS